MTELSTGVAADQPAPTKWPEHLGLSGVIADHARRRPDDIAFVEPTGRVSWADYDRRSTALAKLLRQCGLRPGDRVATLLPDGSAVHVAFVAAEKAGIVVVGIGARAGDQELRHLLTKTGARALITHPVHRGRDMAEVVTALMGDSGPLQHHLVLPEPGAHAVPVLVDGVAADEAADIDITGLALRPDELSLINSTSGTTGMPKCVMHNQARWFYFHRLAAAAGQLSSADVFLSVIPAPFGFGLWTAHFTPAILGSTTILMDRFSAEDAAALIARERVSVLCCVSTQFIMMLNSHALEQHDVSCLRAMFTGGEAVPYERAAAFEEMTNAKVLQFYGANETGAMSATTVHDTRDARLRTAGRVIPEMQVRLFGEDGTDTTESGRGRPACKGPAMCLGYLEDTEANAQLFTPDGWMYGADIVEIRDDYLVVVGRTSDFIIRGGKNISAAALETEVLTHDAVALAAAVAMPDEIFGERVCVYVELQPAASLTLDELNAHLRRRGVSPEWLPERLEVVAAMPRSSGAKVAKGELRADVARRMKTEGVNQR